MVEFFESALRDRDAFIRWAAAEGLKHCEDERLIPVFCRALRDRAHLVKAVAIEWLGTHGDDRAIAPLERLFELRSLEKSAPGLLTAAARSISSIRARMSE